MKFLPRLNKGVLRQFLAALCAGLSAVCSGTAYMWVTPLLGWFEKEDSAIHMTKTETSWVVNAIEIGDLISPMPAGFIVDHVGRKPLLLSTGPIFILTWAIVISTRSVIALYISRFIQGMGVGVMFSVLPIYLGEIAGTKLRGRMGTIVLSMWYLGIFYSYAIGATLNYEKLGWASAAIPIIFMVSSLWLPESPHYYLMHGKEEAAMKVLSWLRGGDTKEAIEEEMQEILKSIAKEKDDKANWKDIVCTRSGRKALFLLEVCSVVSLLGGLVTMLTYVSYTFSVLGADSLNPHLYTLVMGGIILVMVPFSGMLLDHLGRRPVLIISSSTSLACLIVAAIFSYLQEETEIDMSRHIWIAYAAIIIYLVSLACGVEAVVPVLAAELFTSSTRAIAAAVACLSLTIMSFVSLVIFQIVDEYSSMYYNFIIFAVFIFFGLICLYYYLPETKGKTFSEIQDSLK